MDSLGKKEIVQAVLMADNFNDNFSPLSRTTSPSLLPLANTPLIDYSLESLAKSGVEELFIFCGTFIDHVRQHIREGIRKRCSWSKKMVIKVVGSEGCRNLGDALRDLDGKGLLRGHFILMGCGTITNVNLGNILEQHKRSCKFDKGAAMTVVYLPSASDIRTGNEVVIAVEEDSQRLLFHQRNNPQIKERKFGFPLELFLLNSQINIRHDLIDPQIAICSPSALPLFADNFDFETRDDFVRGLLINEEILASTIYCCVLEPKEYAARVSDWETYQIISNDVINRCAYPLVPDMNYLPSKNNVYRFKNVQLARVGILKHNVVIHNQCTVEDSSIIANSVVGKKCQIGKNCTLTNAFIFNDVIIGDNCTLNHCVIASGAKIMAGTTIGEGAVIGEGVVIDKNSKILKHFVQSTEPEDAEGSIRLGQFAYTVPDEEDINERDSDDDEDELPPMGTTRMSDMPQLHYASSAYCSDSEDEEIISVGSVPDDSNIFQSEVVDSMMRSIEEKANPEFLILEINSSRYAYNMALTEVNFYVVKALFGLQPITQATVTTLLSAFNQVFLHLEKVIKNYIRGNDAMKDCLKAIQECCNENEQIKEKLPQIIHYLYDKEILTEDAILLWYNGLNEQDDDDDESTTWIQKSLKKLVDWLNESSDEDDDDDDDDEESN